MNIRVKWQAMEPSLDQNVYDFDEKASWKRSRIRGADIAELISEDFWQKRNIAVNRLRILSPASYAGTYEISQRFEPFFSAKLVPVMEPEKQLEDR